MSNIKYQIEVMNAVGIDVVMQYLNACDVLLVVEVWAHLAA